MGGASSSIHSSDILQYMSRAFVVYILRCSDNTYYTGMTSNLEQRLQEQQEGKHSNCYTYKRRPVELAWAQEFDNTHDAILWERRIHGWSRKKKEALMEEDWDLIQKLAKRKTPFRSTCEEASAEALRDGQATAPREEDAQAHRF